MNRAHGHGKIALALVVASVLGLAGEASAVDVTCAEGSRVDVVTLDALMSNPATHRGLVWRSRETTEIHVGILCGPSPLIYRAVLVLTEGFSGGKGRALPHDFGENIFDLPDAARAASEWMPAGTESDLLITGGPVAFAVGKATLKTRVLGTLSLGPGSVYNGLHFSPIMALRLRPAHLRVGGAWEP